MNAPSRVAGRVLLALTLVLTLAGTLLVAQVTAPAARALTAAAMLQSFDAGDIMSDQVMFNPGTMSVSAVQSFLNAKVPTCEAAAHSTGLPCLKSYAQTTWSRPADPMCNSYTGASNESAATIIVKVGKACNVNPQVLLVILQKEQGLVTDTWPTSSRYRKATGYGCPDSTSVCDATYNGFYNQVYKAAWALQRYTMPPGTGPGTDYYSVYSAYPVGRSSSVLYQDPYSNSSCGTKTVTVKNNATHSLYYYTPYTPNSAALAAGWGTGDSCSAYGNRNFFLYFTSWFGSTHYTATGAINTLWNSLGGATGTLGYPTANEVTETANGGGSHQSFQHGTVYSSPAGTFVLQGAIRSEYNRRGGSRGTLAWPSGAQRSIAGGLLQTFTGGDVYSSSHGTYAVRLDIRAAYANLGGVTGSLGFPTATAAGLSAGTVQRFAGGAVYYTTATGAWGVTGAAYATYLKRREVTGSLGWPTTAMITVSAHGTTGSVQRFQTGATYTVGSTTRTVTGSLFQDYMHNHGPTGGLGWVTGSATSSTASGGGWSQTFAGGSIFYSSRTKESHPLTGSLLKVYLQRGGVKSTLGWPGAKHHVSANGGGYAVGFTSGYLYSSKAGIFAVRTGVLAKYLAKNGPSGSLGWPIGNAHLRDGVWRQSFQHATLSSGTSTVTRSSVSSTDLRSLGAATTSPTRVVAHGRTGTVQRFQNGATYTVGGVTRVVSGGIFKDYLYHYGPTGGFGWPTGSAQSSSASGGGSSQTFAGGSIFYSSRTREAHPLTGSLLKMYLRRGGVNSTLGWPRAKHHVSANGGGYAVGFTSGYLYSSEAGIFAVRTGVLAKYLALGGPSGKLGWPTGNAHRSSGHWIQYFHHGRITWTPGGSTTVKYF